MFTEKRVVLFRLPEYLFLKIIDIKVLNLVLVSFFVLSKLCFEADRKPIYKPVGLRDLIHIHTVKTRFHILQVVLSGTLWAH